MRYFGPYEKGILTRMVKEEQKIAEWLEGNEKEFLDALGILWYQREALTLVLASIKKNGLAWTGAKDDVDRAYEDVLRAFVEGKDVDLDEVRTGVCYLFQHLGQAADKIYYQQRTIGELRGKNYQRPGWLTRLSAPKG